MTHTNRELVDLGDLDELVRHVDRLCEGQGWDDLEDLRHRCRAAVERGRQLWPIASLVEYRLALRAPAPWAAVVLTGDTGIWALGPLAEVAASTHTFAELAPHLPVGPAASVTAHERVVRGEDLTGAHLDQWRHLVHDDGLPLVLQSWEPSYPVATYRDSAAEFPAPDPPPSSSLVALPANTAPVGSTSPITLPDDGATAALRELTAGWSVGWSAGMPAKVAAVDGDVTVAIAAVCPTADATAGIAAADALALMAWAAASGGDSGRRRGMARGRFDAWWTVTALGGCDDDWPLDPDEVGEIANSLVWCVFTDRSAVPGWNLRLAVHDPEDGLAWAIDAAGGPQRQHPAPSGP